MIIQAQKLSFEYPVYDEGAVPSRVLNGLDITIEAGEFVAVLGHNGSGKSTLARHFNALLTPTEGKLFVNGMDISNAANMWEIRQAVGMLFQNPDNQIVATVVEEDVAFGPENLGVQSEEIRKRVDNALAAVDMSEYASAMPHYLSGGQKQRVAIAGVLAMLSDCIVLDEPTAMLDPAGRREVLDAIAKLNKERGITVILITHFMEEAALANRIIVMKQGEVQLDGTPHTVFAQVEKMKALGLSVPQAAELAHALKCCGIPVSGAVLTVADFMKNVATERLQIPDVVAQQTFAPALQPPILEMKNLFHIYNEGTVFEKAAIENINMQINAGEMVAIIGHTGSGKSTLIQHFNALLTPTRGEVLLNGENIHQDKSKLKSIRQHVGLVFQYPEHQLFESTVFRDVAFGPTRMGLSQDEINTRTHDALKVVGIDESLFEKSPFELSGGQKRRVAIAGVLAMRPQVLVLDEPAAGLDPSGKDEILRQIKYMHTNLGITVILVSHSMEDVARLSNRIFVLNKGKIVCEGSPVYVFSRGEMLESMGLAVPQITQLMSTLGVNGVLTVEAAVGICCGGLGE